MSGPSRRTEHLALLGAALFGGLATVGLVVQRLGYGVRTSGGLAALSMLAALGVLAVALPPERAPAPPRPAWWTGVHAAQLLGATLGVLIVHAVIAARLVTADAALVECPAQLVNDAVLVGCVLALVWAVAAPAPWARIGWLVTTLALVGAYTRSAAWWHCDHFEGHRVQHYVVAQLTAAFDATLALLIVMATSRSPAA